MIFHVYLTFYINIQLLNSFTIKNKLRRCIADIPGESERKGLRAQEEQVAVEDQAVGGRIRPESSSHPVQRSFRIHGRLKFLSGRALY